ncbi:hypothetical protein J6590_027892 [Homalodisca vitripennis]|nr:hypothetical protein J6590_027892 [Homalodisca vitripennis]
MRYEAAVLGVGLQVVLSLDFANFICTPVKATVYTVYECPIYMPYILIRPVEHWKVLYSYVDQIANETPEFSFLTQVIVTTGDQSRYSPPILDGRLRRPNESPTTGAMFARLFCNKAAILQKQHTYVWRGSTRQLAWKRSGHGVFISASDRGQLAQLGSGDTWERESGDPSGDSRWLSSSVALVPTFVVSSIPSMVGAKRHERSELIYLPSLCL